MSERKTETAATSAAVVTTHRQATTQPKETDQMATTKSTTTARTRNAGSKTVSKGGAGSKRAHSDAQKKVAENAARVADNKRAQDEAAKLVADTFAAKPSAAKKSESEPKMLATGPKLEEGRVERVKAATAESKLAKAAGWQSNKQTGEWEPVPGGTQQPKPPTPNLDALKAGDKGANPSSTNDDDSTSSSSTKKTSTKRTPKSDGPALAFLVDGQPVAPVHNRLSGISRATGKNNGKKLTTDQLRALLKKNGISEPDSSVWSFTLPNGVTISTVEASKAPKRSTKKSTKSTSKAA